MHIAPPLLLSYYLQSHYRARKMQFFFLLCLPFLFFAGYRLVNWTRYYISARAYGLPIVLLPVSFEDVWWMPLRSLFSFVPSLPFGLGNWYIYTTMGWPTEDLDRSLLRYGENFVLCSPIGNIIVTAEPEVVDVVYGNGRAIGTGAKPEWRMPGSQGQLFAFYGQNVSSTNGDTWKRHRKITGSAFNENAMRYAWEQADLQARSLNTDLEPKQDYNLDRVRSSFDILAMRILTVVGFGQKTELTDIPPGHKESLMDSLGFILQNIMLTLLFNSLRAPDMLLPTILRRLKSSVREFRLYMEELVLQHMRTATARPETSTSTSLLEAMVRANETSKQDEKKSGMRAHLSDSELYGNIFVFNLAGYETTASTFTFALSYLAAHPEIQAWVAEEVDAFYTKDALDAPDYAATYPRMQRCLALMHETLRLASHAPMFVRAPTVPAELRISTPSGPKNIFVDTDTKVGFNIYGAHLSPRWGADVHSFEPRRFIQRSADGGEKVVVPEGPLYAPFMMGPRMCPGKKFSQVEFVSMMARVLVEWRVEPAKWDGDSEDVARERLLSVAGDKVFNVSAHLKRGGDAAVRFVRRKA